MKHIKHASPGIYTPDQIHTRPLLTVYFEDDEIVNYIASERFDVEGAQPTIDMWNVRAGAYVTDHIADPNAAALALITEFEMTPDPKTD